MRNLVQQINRNTMKISKLILAVGLITLFSSTVSAQEITVFPGGWGEQYYQDKEKLTWKEVNEIMMESQAAQKEWQKSKKLALGGIGFGLANLASTRFGLVSNLDQKQTSYWTYYCRCRYWDCRHDILQGIRR